MSKSKNGEYRDAPQVRTQGYLQQKGKVWKVMNCGRKWKLLTVMCRDSKQDLQEVIDQERKQMNGSRY